MDPTRFDLLVASLVRPSNRRGLLRLLAVVPVVSIPLAAPFAALFGEEAAAAKGQKQKQGTQRGAGRQQAGAQKQVSADKKKKRKCARAGRPTTKKHKRCCPGLVKTGTTCTRPSPPPSPPSPPSPPTPPSSCPPGGCPANHICVGRTCQPCTVTCSGSPAVCGNDLQLALGGSANPVYVCPGRYQPPTAAGFSITASKTVIGAGQGQGSANNTILDANNEGTVLNIEVLGSVPVALEQLRIIDGAASGLGAGGINADVETLHMTDCTVSGNSSGDNSNGGGIFVNGGTTLAMTRCTVSGNRASGADAAGGGIFALGNVTLTDSLIEDNHVTGPNGAQGGGILSISGGTPGANIILAGTTEVTENSGGQGGGIWVAGGSILTIAETCRVHGNNAPPGQGGGIYNRGDTSTTVTLQGANPSPIVVDNCHENCVGPVPKCAAAPISC
jgi:hypothetical protein